MLSIVDCTLPTTGSGLSLMGLALVLMLSGAVVWRLPRAHRVRMVLAIAVPLAALSMGVNRASADSNTCPEDTSAAAPATVAPTTTVAATTTTVAATTTTVAPYSVTITYEYGGLSSTAMTVSGSGWTPASVTTNNPSDQTQTITGQVSPTSPTITISADKDTWYREGTITGGTCTDSTSTALATSGSSWQSVQFPVSCTLTGNFSITFSAPV